MYIINKKLLKKLLIKYLEDTELAEQIIFIAKKTLPQYKKRIRFCRRFNEYETSKVFSSFNKRCCCKPSCRKTV